MPWDLLGWIAGEEGEDSGRRHMQNRTEVRHEESQDWKQRCGDIITIDIWRTARVSRLPVEADALDPRCDQWRLRLDDEAWHRVPREMRVERAVEREVGHADGGSEQEVVLLEVGRQKLEQDVELL